MKLLYDQNFNSLADCFSFIFLFLVLSSKLQWLFLVMGVACRGHLGFFLRLLGSTAKKVTGEFIFTKIFTFIFTKNNNKLNFQFKLNIKKLELTIKYQHCG